MSDLDRLLVAERLLQQAQLTSDVRQLDALVHPEATFVGPDGGLVGRDADLDAHRSGTLRLTSLEQRALDARIQDGVGVTVLLARLAGESAGRTFEAELRYTRAWANGPSGWRVVAAHASVVQG